MLLNPRKSGVIVRDFLKTLLGLFWSFFSSPQIQCDRTYQFPRESLKALGDLGLMGLIIPKEMGGMGENHLCAAMVVETIARYGCPSR